MISTNVSTDEKKRGYESPQLEEIKITFQRIMGNSPLEDIEEGEGYGWDDEGEGED